MVRSLLWETTTLFCIHSFVIYLSAGSDCGAGDCSIERQLTPHYVTASFEHSPPLSGCVSRERTPTNQEVHAVVVRGSASSAVRTGTTSGAFNAIDVFIKRVNPNVVHESSIFVLLSTEPTVWHVHAEQTSNASVGQFVISNNSRLERDRRTKLRTKQVAMPTDTARFVQWIRKKYSSLTSLVEARLANVINFRLGNDASASERCEISPRLLSDHVRVSHVEVQETRGCLARWNEGHDGKDVHVIELQSPAVEHVNNSRHDVTVNIRSKSRPVAGRHVVLILKSHVPVLWHVATQNLRGTLDIITDQFVDSNGTNTQSFRVAVESLADLSRSALFSWTCDKYGPPVSYTEAELANKFSLVVDGGDQLSRDRPEPSTETFPNDRMSPSVGNGEPSYHDNTMTEAARSQRLTIIRALHIWCNEENLRITILKRVLRLRGELPSRVSFLEASCSARDNGTHYVFETRTSRCGSTNKTSHDAIAFMNTIVIEWQTAMGGGGGGGRSSLASGVRPHSVQINISCDHPIEATPQDVTSRAEESGGIQFRLKLFRDVTLKNEITTFPQSLNDPNDVIYVQANIFADSCVRVRIQSCSLEPNVSRLISNGCITDDRSVEWVDANSHSSPQNQIFKLRLFRFWGKPMNISIGCRVTVCTACQSELTPSDVPQCKPLDYSCAKPYSYDSRIIANISGGPLRLHSDNAISHHTTASGVAQVDQQQQQQPVEVFNDEHNGGGCEQSFKVEGVSMEIVISIAFAAFIIGILLTASLWCIYVRTGPANSKMKPGMRSAFNSGASTPSSTVPIAVHQVHR